MFGLGVLTIFWITITRVTYSLNYFDYCTLSCRGSQHTMCTYAEGGPSVCREFRSGLANTERQLILDLHNQFRQNVANGWEKRGAQPSSSNMMELKWDQEAETIAQRWADQCQFKGHDHCRKSQTGQDMGQNIAWQWEYSTGKQVTREEAIKKMMFGLYNEVDMFRVSVNSFLFDQKTGHYTQMLWATTRSIGCGFTERAKGYESEFKMVCDYAPAGNYVGLPIYKVGQPCSECPTATSCSSKYPGLCTY